MIQIDMDMPKSCADCPCGDAQDGWCYVHNEVLERMGNGYPSTGTRPDWCPLKEVKHGKWIRTEDGEIWIRVNKVRDSLLSLPTARPSWIPVSERLPKESSIYLVTMKADGDAHLENMFPTRFVYLATYDAVAMHWGYGGMNVIAWMPLPKPYEVKE